MYHARNVEGYQDYHDHDYLGGHHEQLFPNHHFQDDIGSHHQYMPVVEAVAKRSKSKFPNKTITLL